MSKHNIIHTFTNRSLEIPIPPPIILKTTKYEPTQLKCNRIKKILVLKKAESPEEWQRQHEVFGHCFALDLKRTFNLPFLPKLACKSCDTSECRSWFLQD